MCREMITSETRILIMDNFIDKVVEKLDKEYQDKRKEVIAAREAAKADGKYTTYNCCLFILPKICKHYFIIFFFRK